MEVGQAVLALDLIDPELDLAEGLLLVLVEVGKGNLNNTTLERVVGVFCMRCQTLAQSRFVMDTYSCPETC